MSTSYDAAVRSWAAHLRSGGRTPWSQWRESGHPVPADAPPVSDAVHLELVRRLGLPALTDEVLRTPLPGRGISDRPLAWPEVPAFGPRPVEPEDVPAEELLRLAVALIVGRETDLAGPRAAHGRLQPLRPWRRRFQLHGPPLTTARAGAALRTRMTETSWRPRHVVVAVPFALMVQELWSARVRDGGFASWRSHAEQLARARSLPPALDPAGTAARLAASGAEVHVVVGAGPQEVLSVLAERFGTPTQRDDSPIDAVATDLRRRLHRQAAQRLGADWSRTHALRLPEAEPGSRVRPPRPARAWAVDAAHDQARRLSSAADYAVHGDPGALAAEATAPDDVDPARTLDAAVRVIRSQA